MAKMEYAEAKTSRKGEKEMSGHGKKSSAGEEMDHMEIHKSKNGGHIVVHHYHPMSHGMDLHGPNEMNWAAAPGGEKMEPPKEPEHHVFGPSEGHEMLAHVANHMDLHGPEYQTGAQEEEEEGEKE